MVELRQLSKEQVVMGFVASCVEEVANKYLKFIESKEL